MKKKSECKGITCGATGTGGCFYFLGFVGAVIYYISTSTGFWSAVLGVLKSFIWPVFFVHGGLKLFGV